MENIRKFRGNDTYTDNAGESRYVSSGNLTADNYKYTPCGNCGLMYDKNGHDGCLGGLPGLMNACCGHGIESQCYVQFMDGSCVRGKDAKVIQEILKKYKDVNKI